jgi:hypothetical protein
MIFVDYAFEKINNHILFDKELGPESLGVKSGDKFVVHVTEDDRIVFVKMQTEDQ